jgi:putative PIN family toxin of toxin-antitoxin system
MRLVLDTSAVVAGFRSPMGASGEILRLAHRGKITMLASVGLYLEYEAVLKRPEHLKAAALSEADVGAALDAMASFVEPVETFFLWRPRLRDADDDMVLEAAVNGRADAIVTFNLRDFATSLAEFGIRALLPADVLRRL